MSPLGTVLFGPIIFIEKKRTATYNSAAVFIMSKIGPNRTVPNGLIFVIKY